MFCKTHQTLNTLQSKFGSLFEQQSIGNQQQLTDDDKCNQSLAFSAFILLLNRSFNRQENCGGFFVDDSIKQLQSNAIIEEFINHYQQICGEMQFDLETIDEKFSTTNDTQLNHKQRRLDK
jgi:hypothetical protein